MTPPPPDRLAGFADGELDPDTRRAVEDWLATDPDAADLLRDQEQLIPANADFWERVEPPQPDELAWANVRNRVAARIRPPHRTSRRRAFAVAASVVALAGVGIGAWLAQGSRPLPKAGDPPGTEIATQPRVVPEALVVAPRAVNPDPLAEFAVLPMANSRDVLVDTAAGRTLEALPVADHPLPGDLPLAAPGDVRIGAMGRRPDGTFPPLPWVSGTASEPPLIYAARR
jgi:hypothetical protein